MSIATALISADAPSPVLAERAVGEALEKAGLSVARSVLLFMTPEFSSQVQPILSAVARRASSLEVVGGLSAGVFTESGWQLDRPSIAVMVFGDGYALSSSKDPDQPVLSYFNGSLPADWKHDVVRYGGLFSGGFSGNDIGIDSFWQHGRPVEEAKPMQVQISGAKTQVGYSCGLQLLGAPQRIEQSYGFDLERLGGHDALTSLKRALPADLQDNLHACLPQLVCLITSDASAVNAPPNCQGTLASVIAITPTGALILEEEPFEGYFLTWAIRRPMTAEDDMRRMLGQLSGQLEAPAGALLFSSIGRGPLFYGGEDLELAAVRETFPGLPVLGVYGTGQIFPAGNATSPNNQVMRSAVVTAVFGR